LPDGKPDSALLVWGTSDVLPGLQGSKPIVLDVGRFQLTID
jgi:hypothetical protein